MPRISVVMPVWNVELYLRACMDSILGQTFRDFEMICIDDASDDGSPQILAEYAAADPRVKLLRTEHVGAYLARKAGVDIACGEFVYFMDSDDILDTNAFLELMEIVEREHLDQIIFSAEVFSDEGDTEAFLKQRAGYKRYYAIPEDLCNRPMSGADLMFALECAGHFFVSPPFRLTRLAPFKERDYPFPHGAPFHADEFFTPVSLYFSNRAMIVKKRYYKRRVRPGSISTAANMEKVHFSSLLNVIFALCNFKPMQEDLPSRKTELTMRMQRVVRALLRRGKCLDAETQDSLLSDLTFPVSPDVRFFLSTCFLPALQEWEACAAKLKEAQAECSRTRRLLDKTSAKLRDAQSRCNRMHRLLDKTSSKLLARERTLAASAQNEAAQQFTALKEQFHAREWKLGKEVSALKKSASYRVGLFITWPLRLLCRLFRGGNR